MKAVQGTVSFAILFTISGETVAQSIVDDSAQQLSLDDKKAMFEAVTYRYLDPYSAQFRRLRVVGKSICGEVNTKSKIGAYVGFKPFGFEREYRRGVTFDPDSDPRDFVNEEEIREMGCYSDGLPESEWKNLAQRGLTCLKDLELLIKSQSPEPTASGRDFNELFATVKKCAADRLIPRKLAVRWGVAE